MKFRKLHYTEVQDNGQCVNSSTFEKKTIASFKGSIYTSDANDSHTDDVEHPCFVTIVLPRNSDLEVHGVSISMTKNEFDSFKRTGKIEQK